ncbi:MAG: F0F1 ATP synthase subunit delta, partial [Oscillospiraceae bacterium]|nr:F0F1 ATP synthase subunit delta [Oscillospiraceae bacterium]
MPSIIYYAIINFVILVAIIWLLFGKMIKKAFSKRDQELCRSLDEAEDGRQTERSRDMVIEADNRQNEAEKEELRSRTDENLGMRKSVIDRDLQSELEAREKDMEAELPNYRLGMLRHVEKDTLRRVAANAAAMFTQEPLASRLNGFEELCAKRIAATIRPWPGNSVYLLDHDTLPVTISSAKALSQESVDLLERAARAAFADEMPSGTLELAVEEDDKLIRGVKVRICDTVYDGSISNILSNLAERVKLDAPDTKSGAEELQTAIIEGLKKVSTDVDIYQLGRVISVSDGICRISGLSDVMYGEMLDFIETGITGMVLDLGETYVGCVVFGAFEKIEEGAEVRRSGHIIAVPVGEAMLGRVVNALGEPIDGRGEIRPEAYQPIEAPAPGILDRRKVNVPLNTGLTAIDALVPIGRGQRELIVGDRQTGKTAIAIDTIINQRSEYLKGEPVYCIYVAVGQKGSTVANIVETLRSKGAMDYTVVVAATAADPAALQYYAPFAG